MSKFVPGPYKAYESTEACPFPAGVPVSIGTAEGKGSKLSIVCDMIAQAEDGKYSPEVTRATAELLAAAPELLDMLQKLTASNACFIANSGDTETNDPDDIETWPYQVQAQELIERLTAE